MWASVGKAGHHTVMHCEVMMALLAKALQVTRYWRSEYLMRGITVLPSVYQVHCAMP